MISILFSTVGLIHSLSMYSLATTIAGLGCKKPQIIVMVNVNGNEIKRVASGWSIAPSHPTVASFKLL